MSEPSSKVHALSGQEFSGANRRVPEPAPPRPSNVRYVPARCQAMRIKKGPSVGAVIAAGRRSQMARGEHTMASAGKAERMADDEGGTQAVYRRGLARE